MKFRFIGLIHKVKVLPLLHRHKNFFKYRFGLHLRCRRVLHLILDFKRTWIRARRIVDVLLRKEKFSESQKAGQGCKSASALFCDSVNHLSVILFRLQFHGFYSGGATLSLSGHMCVLVTQLCLNLCDRMDCSLTGSSVHGILQARIQEWVVIPSQGIFPGDLPDPGIKPWFPALQADSLHLSHQGSSDHIIGC